MAFLIPDKVRVENIGNVSITINEKIIPDGVRATKDIASWCKKGDLVKPNKKLNDGTGKPKGITIHNTGDVTPAKGTNAAEQYARATYPNGNMSGVVVHFWVNKNHIWQQLKENERGWHAADGSKRRKDHRGGQSGGNVDTIAIEHIGKDPLTEETGAILTAYLCKKYNLDPMKDVYTHNYWMYGADKAFQGVRKNCPIYILPHWNSYLNRVRSILTGQPNDKGENADMLYGMVLKRGAKGTQVTKLQNDLITLGYGEYMGGYGADGSFGGATEKAVLAFQKDNGLAVDGSVGPATQAKIKELLDKRNQVNPDKEIAALKQQVLDLKNKLTAEQAASKNKTNTINSLNAQIVKLNQKISNAVKALQ